MSTIELPLSCIRVRAARQRGMTKQRIQRGGARWWSGAASLEVQSRSVQIKPNRCHGDRSRKLLNLLGSETIRDPWVRRVLTGGGMASSHIRTPAAEDPDRPVRVYRWIGRNS